MGESELRKALRLDLSFVHRPKKNVERNRVVHTKKELKQREIDKIASDFEERVMKRSRSQNIKIITATHNEHGDWIKPDDIISP
jgi:hypothetical protein